MVQNSLMRAAVFSVLLGLPVACGSTEVSKDSVQPVAALPAMRWDHRPESDIWTRATLAALRNHGAALAQVVPADIDTYCPGYETAGPAQRRAFWAGLLSALAKHESTWNPRAVGGGDKWFGLVQIAPATARGYGCAAGSGAALRDGAANLSCAVRIVAQTVPRDGVVSRGGRGVAADWAPFLNRSKRADIASWTSTQSYCN